MTQTSKSICHMVAYPVYELEDENAADVQLSEHQGGP